MRLHASGSRHGWIAALFSFLLCLFLVFPAQAEQMQERYFVDFDYIKQVAPDTVGWLYQPDGPFNAPTLYSKNSKYYLRHRFDQEHDQQGSLFFTGDSAPDFNAPLLVLHGNNTYDGALFGSLNQYRNDETYYQNNTTLYLLTPHGNQQLDVFAGIRVTQNEVPSWLPAGDAASLTEALPGILERSFLTPLPDTLPEEGDQWLVLWAEGKAGDSASYLIYTRRRPIVYAENATPVELTQIEMDNRETLNGPYTVEGMGQWLVYGQNDPSWDRLIFEAKHSSRRRPFGDGGCGPTAIASVFANLLTPEELCKINAYSPDSYGYTICDCSVTEFYCNRRHLPHRIDTPEEMLRYFPLVIGNFATGNNTLSVQGRYDSFGSSMDYLPALCSHVYGLHMEQTTDREVAYNFLRSGKGMIVTCTTSRPFTTSSHYITLAGADDEYVYILDPLRREAYNDPRERLTILTPGLVRMDKEDAMNLIMWPLCMISRPDAVEETGSQSAVP